MPNNIQEDATMLKENTMIMTNGEEYFYYINKMKEEIKKEKSSTYIHFRSEENNFNPESNMTNGIFPITKTSQLFNLKNEQSLQTMIERGLYDEGVQDEKIHYFLKMFINQVYKCINTKYYHKEKLSISEIFEAFYNFEKMFSEYNQYTETKIHDKSVEEFISVMYGMSKIEMLLKNIENKFDINHYENLNVSKIISEKPIELFATSSIYNETLFYLFFNEIVSKLHIMNKNRNEIDLKMDKVYIIFDQYPKDLIKEPCLYAQLRALGVKLIFPKSEDSSYCTHLETNSTTFEIKNKIQECY
jgi:hypothetical protein